MEIAPAYKAYFQDTKNLIFDFGGVIIDIDYHHTLDGFRKLGFVNVEEAFNQLSQKPLFDLFETGKISAEKFFTSLKSFFPGIKPNTVDLMHAWNAMLGEFPEENNRLLHKLKKSYRTFMLSNTNETHINYYYKKLKRWYNIETMGGFFEKVYFSYQVGLRKPDEEVFHYVLRDSGLRADETLFIDDSPQHVEGAIKAGLKAYHLNNGEKITDMFIV